MAILLVKTVKSKFDGKTVFSKLNFKSAFNWIELDKVSRKHLVFKAGNRLFCNKRINLHAVPLSAQLGGALRSKASYYHFCRVGLEKPARTSTQKAREHEFHFRVYGSSTLINQGS